MRTLQLFALLAALFLGACANPVGRNYEKPAETEVTETFKAPNAGGTAEPKLAQDAWWTLFHDKDLNQLMEMTSAGNLDARAALARLDQAQAFIRVARADMLPNLGAGSSVTLSRQGVGSSSSSGQIGGTTQTGSVTGTNTGGTTGTGSNASSGLGGGLGSQGITREIYDAGLSLDWELDFWGRVRRLVEGAKADRNAAEADLDTILLSVRAQAARTYYSIRALDEEIRVVRETQGTRRTALDLQVKQKDVGAASDLEVSRANAELASTLATEQSLLRSRGQLENALGTLTGHRASNFKLAPRAWNPRAPRVSTGIPGELVVRRPDVARAEEQLVAANARIGSAQAEFLPRVTLGGNAGFSGLSASEFVNWSSRAWAFSPSVQLPVFQGGRLKGNLARVKAEYDEALANYQQQCLVAFEDVETALNDLATLRAELSAQSQVVSASRRVEELTNRRYTDGAVNYFEVVDAQRTTLDAQRREAQLRGLQFTGTVTLIQALGGGWDGLEKSNKDKTPAPVPAATTAKAE